MMEVLISPPFLKARPVSFEQVIIKCHACLLSLRSRYHPWVSFRWWHGYPLLFPILLPTCVQKSNNRNHKLCLYNPPKSPFSKGGLGVADLSNPPFLKGGRGIILFPGLAGSTNPNGSTPEFAKKLRLTHIYFYDGNLVLIRLWPP